MIDKNGPLVGVTVMEKDTKNGTTTTSASHYRLKVSSSKKIPVEKSSHAVAVGI